MTQKSEFTVSVAPMMDWTDRHCRWFHRRLSAQTRLYTEMVVADAVIHGPRDRLLGFDSTEHPVALQIGGSDPAKLAKATEIGAGFGYDEVNINIGCPSDRVQSGAFGACLMKDAPLVAECYRAMAGATNVPVTVKCRLGVDDQEVEKTLPNFIETVANAGATHFIIHARKAWLKGLSPKENRNVPLLNYELVRAMKACFPELEIVLNGGLTDIAESITETAHLDGFMLGRAAYHTPWILTEIDARIYNGVSFMRTRQEVVEDVIKYTRAREDDDPSTKAIIRHIMGIFAGQPGARLWRRRLSEGLSAGVRPSQIIEAALAAYDDVVRNAA